MTEQDVINNVYYLLEQDSTLWEVDSDEYLTARGMLNIGIGRWENYDDTRWKELFSTLDAAADGTKTLTSGTYSYACPTNMKFPSSYVRIQDSAGQNTFFTVLPVTEIAKHITTSENFCYFTGNDADGYNLNFNPNLTLTTGDTIKYEYYKKATLTDNEADVIEMKDPYFLSYFIASHMSEGGIDPDMMNMAEARLEAMRTNNMSGLFGIPDAIEPSLDSYGGFGY